LDHATQVKPLSDAATTPKPPMNQQLENYQSKANKAHALVNHMGNLLVTAFHLLALFAIGAATVYSAFHSFLGMMDKGVASISDLLLLFIYLEIGAMVGIYFQTQRMPVRFLIYIAITALTRLLVEDISKYHRLSTEILIVAIAILVLAIATLVIKYSSAKFSANNSDHSS
jgi:protein PsiE